MACQFDKINNAVPVTGAAFFLFVISQKAEQNKYKTVT